MVVVVVAVITAFSTTTVAVTPATADTTPLTVVRVDFAGGTPQVSTVSVPGVAGLHQLQAAEPDAVITPLVTYHPLSGADPLRAQQWALDALRTDAAHQAGYDGSGQTVAVIDTGIMPDHEDLAGRVTATADFIDEVPGFRYHGTAVAGIIAANAGNGLGGVGVAPGVRLLDARGRRPRWPARPRRRPMLNHADRTAGASRCAGGHPFL